MTDYIVVFATKYRDMADQVNARLREDYILQGGIAVVRMQDTNHYHQAMAK